MVKEEAPPLSVRRFMWVDNRNLGTPSLFPAVRMRRFPRLTAWLPFHGGYGGYTAVITHNHYRYYHTYKAHTHTHTDRHPPAATARAGPLHFHFKCVFCIVFLLCFISVPVPKAPTTLPTQPASN